jgi:hypothetical protein
MHHLRLNHWLEIALVLQDITVVVLTVFQTTVQNLLLKETDLVLLVIIPAGIIA